MLPRSFMSSISAESRCQWASHGSLPHRFAIQGYCWWDNRFRYGFVAIRNNYLRDFTSHHFTLVNDGSMPHSIDFHAAQTPWSVNYQPVAPGKSFSFTWRANYPGVFMYHCGAPVTIYHMVNGMYGAIIVNPASGWTPAQEFVLLQSEFYTSQLPDGTYTVDANKLNAGIPDYVVFNGYANQYKESPLVAKAGQRIRLFIVNAGPVSYTHLRAHE